MLGAIRLAALGEVDQVVARRVLRPDDEPEVRMTAFQLHGEGGLHVAVGLCLGKSQTVSLEAVAVARPRSRNAGLPIGPAAVDERPATAVADRQRLRPNRA